jgi:outer membrane protein TolC
MKTSIGVTRNLRIFLALAGLALPPAAAWAQQAAPPGQAQALTLRQAVSQALERSRDVTLARLRYEAAQRETAVSRSRFMPNLYAGSGAAYSSGFPLAAGGGAPAVVTLTYSQALFDPMARSEVRAAEQHQEQMRLAFDGVRDAVITRVASAYLELAKLRRSRDLLLDERASAARILTFTRQRADAGLELPIEVTRAQLTAAKIEQSIAKLENGGDSLAEQLRADLGLASDQAVQVAAEDLPPVAIRTRPPSNKLYRTASTSNRPLRSAKPPWRACKASAAAAGPLFPSPVSTTSWPSSTTTMNSSTSSSAIT